MRLRELIFQGIFGCTTAVRLEFADGVTRVRLPSGVSHEELQDLVVSLLYPSEMPPAMRMQYSEGDAKVALVLSHRGRNYRIVRRTAANSLRLQKEEGGDWTDVAEGDNVQPALHRTLALPDFSIFWPIDLWRFEDSPKAAQGFDVDSVDPRIRNLVIAYREAHKAESLDDKVVSLESRIAECKKAIGEGVSIEAKLEQAYEKMSHYEIGELAEDDVGLIREKEERLGEFREKIDRLMVSEEEEREEIYRSIPDVWWKKPEFWVGAVITLACLVVSVGMHDTPWRLAAMGNVAGLGLSAWILLTYFSGLEKANVHQMRLDSIKRRLNQVREEQVALQEHLNHLMIHARVDNSTELTERVAKGAQLRVMIEKMEKRMAEIRRDPSYAQKKEELDEFESELAAVLEEKGEYQGDMMSAYQLESDLSELGIDPASVLEETPVQEAAPEESASPMEQLLACAQASGQLDGSSLADTTRKMWGKIAGHVLGERFKAVDISENGKLVIGDLGEAQIDMWRRTRASEERVVLSALALSLQVNAADKSKRGFFETILIRDPAEVLTGEQAKKLSEVFGSASKRGNVVLVHA